MYGDSSYKISSNLPATSLSVIFQTLLFFTTVQMKSIHVVKSIDFTPTSLSAESIPSLATKYVRQPRKQGHWPLQIAQAVNGRHHSPSQRAQLIKSGWWWIRLSLQYHWKVIGMKNKPVFQWVELIRVLDSWRWKEMPVVSYLMFWRGLDLSGRGRTRDQNVAASISGRSGGRIFFSRVTFCAKSYYFSYRSTLCYRSST